MRSIHERQRLICLKTNRKRRRAVPRVRVASGLPVWSVALRPHFWSYHALMRFVFVLILMALLPLRSWSGDVMAVHMATQNAVQSVALPEISSPVHADCHDEAPAKAGTVCENCAFCQACSSPALVVPMVSLGQRSQTSIAPAQTPVAYASAELALRSKPPIS